MKRERYNFAILAANRVDEGRTTYPIGRSFNEFAKWQATKWSSPDSR